MDLDDWDSRNSWSSPGTNLMLSFLIWYSLNFDNQIPIHISTVRSLFVLIFFWVFYYIRPLPFLAMLKSPSWVLIVNCNLDLGLAAKYQLAKRVGMPQSFKPEHKTVVKVLWPFWDSVVGTVKLNIFGISIRNCKPSDINIYKKSYSMHAQTQTHRYSSLII